jgi:hypothetical protein
VRGAIAVAALFGLGHALSGIWFGRGLGNTAYQVVQVGIWAFPIAALRWHLGTIWPLVALHGLDDWLQINSPGRNSDMVQLVEALGEIAYGVVLLRLLAARRTVRHRTRPDTGGGSVELPAQPG